MIALLQRVSQASVVVDGATIAQINNGLVVLACVERGDTEADAGRMAQRLAGYRVFSDAKGKMNLSVGDTDGRILLVPQFTLGADTKKGMRPSFSGSADPILGQTLFESLASHIDSAGLLGGTGVFGADMQVTLTNDGPVTFWLNT